jgi:chorismate synthase
MGNTFGKLFTLTTFGESHGPAIGAVVDGCPARLKILEADIQAQLDRRRPGQSAVTTSRTEKDKVRILSGIEKDLTLGSPIALTIENTNVRPSDYDKLADIPRPSHADYTYKMKYGILASSGGGRASARETAGRVAGGAIAEAFLRERFGIEVVAWVSSVGVVSAADMTERNIKRPDVDRNDVRCPDPASSEMMEAAIKLAADEGDSLGGMITCVCRNVPVGWGEPVFDKLHAVLAHAMLSIPAARGFEVGAGFAAAKMRGSEHNDMFVKKGRHLGTATNRSGGVQGGLSNGEPIVFRVAFKPVATIKAAQQTVTYDGKPTVLQIEKGRHDPCVLPRAVPVVEAMAALVLADMALWANSYGQSR